MADPKEPHGAAAGTGTTSADAISGARGGERTGGGASDLDDVKAQLDVLRRDFQQLGDMLGLKARQRYEDAREQAVDLAEHYRSEAERRYSSNMQGMEDQIRRNPIGAAAAFVGIGFLIGAILRR